MAMFRLVGSWQKIQLFPFWKQLPPTGKPIKQIYPILNDKGKISAPQAKLKAETEFEKYRIVQDKNYISDFDNEIKRLKGN